MDVRRQSVLAACCLAAVVAVFARPSTAAAAGCADRVLTDWSDGRIDGTYSAPCLRGALRAMPEDVRIYGTAEADIQAALRRTLSSEPTRTTVAAGPISARASTAANKLLAAAIFSGALALLVVLLRRDHRRRHS